MKSIQNFKSKSNLDKQKFYLMDGIGYTFSENPPLYELGSDGHPKKEEAFYQYLKVVKECLQVQR